MATIETTSLAPKETGSTTGDVRSEAEEPRSVRREDITFLMVGCQRCGSTWVYEALKEHPEICLPAAKQTHYFDESYENGIEWYLSHFSGLAPQHKAVGEVATSYCLTDVIPLVAREFPDIRIIMAMREPVERAKSYYRSRAPHEGWKSFEEALERDPEIIRRGEYADQIEALQKYYPAEKLLFLLYDDLKRDEVSYIESIYRFLGVDPSFRPSVIGNPVRAAMFPRLRRMLKQMGLTPLVNLINNSFVGDAIRRVLRKTRTSGPKSAAAKPVIRTSLHDHFAPYNDRLEALIGRTLDKWSPDQ